MCNVLWSDIKLPLDANSVPTAWATTLGEGWQCHLWAKWGWWYLSWPCFPDYLERPPRKGHGCLLVGEAPFPGSRSIRDALCPSLPPTRTLDILWACTLNGCKTWTYSSVFHNQNLWAQLGITAKNWWTRSWGWAHAKMTNVLRGCMNSSRSRQITLLLQLVLVQLLTGILCLVLMEVLQKGCWLIRKSLRKSHMNH